MRAGRPPRRSVRRAFVCVVLAVVLPTLHAGATWAAGQQSPATVTPSFARYLAGETYRQTAIEAARRHNDNLPDSCKTMSFALSAVVTVYAPVRMEGGQPVEGAWAEPVMATGCGKTLRFAVLTIVAPDKPAMTLSLIPGDSRADPMLQRDSVKDVLDHASVASGGCKDMVVTDTRFEDWEGGPVKGPHGREARPWRETWTVWACGKLLDVPVHFTPNDRGTLIEVKSAEVKPKP
jgi:hypothetical protein